MIFIALQLIEKKREHNSSFIYIIFVDLKKAYDSVPRLALRQVLEMYGIPPTLVVIIKSMHEGMCAEVRVGDVTTNAIDVCKGVSRLQHFSTFISML